MRFYYVTFEAKLFGALAEFGPETRTVLAATKREAIRAARGALKSEGYTVRDTPSVRRS